VVVVGTVAEWSRETNMASDGRQQPFHLRRMQVQRTIDSLLPPSN
jgi:hypothetical protein